MLQFINRVYKSITIFQVFMISIVLKIFKVPIQVNGAVAVHKLGWGLRNFFQGHLLYSSYRDISLPSIFVPIFLEGHLLYSYWDISLPPIVVPIFSKD